MMAVIAALSSGRSRAHAWTIFSSSEQGFPQFGEAIEEDADFLLLELSPHSIFSVSFGGGSSPPWAPTYGLSPGVCARAGRDIFWRRGRSVRGPPVRIIYAASADQACRLARCHHRAAG